MLTQKVKAQALLIAVSLISSCQIANSVQAEEVTRANYTDSVTGSDNSSADKGALSTEDLSGKLGLWATVRVGAYNGGEIMPILPSESTLPHSVLTQPEVVAKTNQWRSWYENLIRRIGPYSGANIPSGYRATLDITVSKDRKLVVAKEFDSNSTEASERYVQAFENALQQLNAQPSLAFPDHSTQFVTLRLEIDGVSFHECKISNLFAGHQVLYLEDTL